MFLPATIDLANPEKYTLSIRIDSQKFMFSLSKPDDGKNFCFRESMFENTNESLQERLQRIIYELNFLTQQFAQTNVIFNSSNYQVVPDELFEINRRNELFYFSTNENQHIVVNELPKYKSVILSSVDKDIYGFMKRSLYNPHFYNQAPILVDFFEGHKRSTSLHSKMYVNFTENLFDIICFEGSKLLYVGSYDELSPNDKIYHILKIWESLRLNQLNDQLLIAGVIDNDLVSILRRYIKNIELLDLPSEVYLWHEDAQRVPLDLLSFSL